MTFKMPMGKKYFWNHHRWKKNCYRFRVLLIWTKIIIK